MFRGCAGDSTVAPATTAVLEVPASSARFANLGAWTGMDMIEEEAEHGIQQLGCTLPEAGLLRRRRCGLAHSGRLLNRRVPQKQHGGDVDRRRHGTGGGRFPPRTSARQRRPKGLSPRLLGIRFGPLVPDIDRGWSSLLPTRHAASAVVFPRAPRGGDIGRDLFRRCGRADVCIGVRGRKRL